MRTALAHRGTGVALAMMDHLLAEAARRGYSRLSLETGAPAAFLPARRLYERFGFAYCGPFGDYIDDPYSVFMSKLLAPTGPGRHADTHAALDPLQIARTLTELWSPRVIAELDDNYIKVARVQGSLAWHRHAHEDELFLVLEGRLRLEFEDGAVELGPGEMHVVPKGVLHNPIAEQECLLMLVERKATLHTGDVVTDKTRSLDEQLRPLRAPPHAGD
jgi:mannose-6-phosphate isomerase-like protein (cupin superfamily)